MPTNDCSSPTWVDLILADLRAGLAGPEIARWHGVTRHCVSQIPQAHGIPPLPRTRKPPPPRSTDPRHWREDEVAFVANYPALSAAAFAAQLGRPVGGVRWVRERLVKQSQRTTRGSRWAAPVSGQGTPLTEDELALIADLTLPAAEVARRTGRTAGVITVQHKRRGLTATQQRRWTAEEHATIEAMPERANEEIAAVLGRTPDAVRNQRSRLIQEGKLANRRGRRPRR